VQTAESPLELEDITAKSRIDSSRHKEDLEALAESMSCGKSLTFKSAGSESELWELDCGDGEILRVRCFDDACYIKQ